MTVEMMCDKVIQKFGFENKWTIWFFECAEVLTPDQLLNAFICLDAMPICEDEDE